MPSFGYRPTETDKTKAVQPPPDFAVDLQDPHPGDILAWDENKNAWTNVRPPCISSIKKLVVKGEAEMQNSLTVKGRAILQGGGETSKDLKTTDLNVKRSVSFFGSKPTGRQNTTVQAAPFEAKSSGLQDDSATFGGYTIGQVVAALKNLGLLN